MLSCYDKHRRLAMALYQNKGVVMESPYPNTPKYLVAGRHYMVWDDDYKVAFAKWAKAVRLNQYDFVGGG